MPMPMPPNDGPVETHRPSANATANEPYPTTAQPQRLAPEHERSGEHGISHAARWSWLGTSTAKLAQGFVFGILFGFLLQKGGVAKFDILVGALLLENFVVVQVMASAIIVGMLGVYLLNRCGLLELQIKETAYGSNVAGGLIFGVGFGLLAYCPGTNAAAVGQGNLDALVGILGLLLGSYLFALSSNFNFPTGTIMDWGKRGKITLADILGISRGVCVAFVIPILIAVLVVLEVYGFSG